MMLSPSVRIDVSVSTRAWIGREPGIVALCRRCVRATLEFDAAKRPRKALFRTKALEVSILLASDARVRALNRIYRGKDKPTNVLSFPADDAGVMPGPVLLGDIVLAFETTRREAAHDRKAFKAKTFKAHAAHLVVHGVLHLLGYDHEKERDAQTMEQMERRILARLGFSDPYAGTVVVKPSRATPRRAHRKPSARP